MQQHKHIKTNKKIQQWLFYVFNICYALPPPPPSDVQIYSPNLFLNYYRFVMTPYIGYFLRGQKVLISEFAVEAIIIIFKEHKKKASSGIFTLYESQ